MTDSRLKKRWTWYAGKWNPLPAIVPIPPPSHGDPPLRARAAPRLPDVMRAIHPPPW